MKTRLRQHTSLGVLGSSCGGNPAIHRRWINGGMGGKNVRKVQGPCVQDKRGSLPGLSLRVQPDVGLNVVRSILR